MTLHIFLTQIKYQKSFASLHHDNDTQEGITMTAAKAMTANMFCVKEYFMSGFKVQVWESQ